MEKQIIAAFDFDGTITTKDTLLEFIKFTKGTVSFYSGFLLHAPVLIAFKLKLYPNWKAKQRIFSYFFKGMRYTEFCKKGEEFAGIIEKMIHPSKLNDIRRHQEDGNTVYVISASIDEWVAPWCKKAGIDHVLGTKIEVDGNGILTGRFLSPNCYGKEKVNRLLEKEPDRDSYILYAYGDSRGDRELLAFADKGIWCNKNAE